MTLLAGLLAAGLVIAGPAFAGAFTQTDHVHNGSISDTIPISCLGPGTTSYTGTGNSITHFTENATGDWFTTTTVGDAVLTTTAGGTGAPATYQGHVQDWFGEEDNGTTQPTNVSHATFNFTGTNVVTGAPFEMHGAFDTTINGNGTTTANHLDVHCNGG